MTLTLFSYREPRGTRPDYVELNQLDDGRHTLTVRGAGGIAGIVLSQGQLVCLANAIAQNVSLETAPS